jgi:pimeloyl-ACP methyl ester carboxylesterase
VFSLEEWKAFDAAFIEQQQKLMPEPDRWQEMLQMYEDMWNGAVISKDLFSKVTCPVLVMGGERDINSPMLTAIASYQQLPQAQLSIIPNAPHPCFLVNFDAVWGAVAPFISND